MRLCLKLGLVAVAAQCVSAAAPGAPADAPLLEVPSGYVGRVVLHVDYETGPARVVGTAIGGDPNLNGEEFVSPITLVGMRVVGDRFYFHDREAYTVKVFRAPGTLVWEYKPDYDDFRWYTVAPDHKVYVVWGMNGDRILCLGADGKRRWTRDAAAILPPAAEMRRLGLKSVHDPSCLFVEWTACGLAIRLQGEADRRQGPRMLLSTLDAEGRVGRAFEGWPLIGRDRALFDYSFYGVRGDLGATASRRLLRRGEDGKPLGEVVLNFAPEGGNPPRDRECLYTIGLDPCGGFLAETALTVPQPVRLGVSDRIGRFDSTSLQRRLWRFDAMGRVKEVWGFPHVAFVPFLLGAAPSPLVVSEDGSVYYLKYGATGVDVIRYAKE